MKSKIVFEQKNKKFNEVTIDVSHMSPFEQRNLLSVLRTGHDLNGIRHKFMHNGKFEVSTYDSSGRLV